MAPKTQAIGIDIGGTHTTSAMVDISAGQLSEATLARAAVDHTAGAKQILQQWAEALNRTLSETGTSRLLGFGFAMPGPFDYRSGISRMEHKFKSLYGLNIPDALRPLLKGGQDLPMRFLNDATSFAIGESWLGEGRGYQKVVVITLGTGFGSAFLDDDVPVVQGTEVPKEGCLWHLPFKEGVADDYFSTRWFVRAYKKHTGKAVSGVKTLMDKVDADPAIRHLFAEFGHNLAECLAPWLRRFDAEILIIGGNIAHALPLFESAFQENLHTSGVSTLIATSKLREKAALLGSARLLDDAFWSSVSKHLPKL